MHKKYLLIVTLLTLTITSCVYLPDLQQGNLLKLENIDRVEIGMTKSQIRYLLGGPVVGNPYQTDRWDYIYLYQDRMDANPTNEDQRYWLVVYFDENKVTRIEKDVTTSPNGSVSYTHLTLPTILLV